jgi:hypothetical protein
MAVRCVTQPTLRVTRVLLFYRPSTDEKWKSTPMSRTRKGWYTGVVPAESAVGSSVQFYVEARNGARLTASAGRGESPNFVVLKPGARPVGRGALAALRLAERREPVAQGPEESPIDLEAKEKARAAEEARDRRRRAGSFIVGAGVGSGLGLHFGRMLEHRKDKEMPAGFTPAGLGHVSPEVGYQWTDRIAFTIQSRHQYVPPGGSGDTGTQGYPAKSAHAVFGRVYYYWRDAGDLQLVGTATLGGGTAFRLRVPPNESEDPERRLRVNDTIDGGPVALGPGALALYHLSRTVALAADLKLLFGLHRFVTLFDLTIGPQLTF